MTAPLPPDLLKSAAVAPPSLRRRLACLIYETLLLFGLSLLAGAVGAALLALTGKSQPAAVQMVGFVIFGCYFVWFWSRRGQTLPMQTWHIRIVTPLGSKPSTTRALARYLAAWVWVLPGVAIAHALGLKPAHTLIVVIAWGCAYALSARLAPSKQFWHDTLCGTRLVHAPPQPKPAN